MYLFEHVVGSKWDSMESSLVGLKTDSGMLSWLFGSKKVPEASVPIWWSTLISKIGSVIDWEGNNHWRSVVLVLFAHFGVL
jgi:hypothetical protein